MSAADDEGWDDEYEPEPPTVEQLEAWASQHEAQRFNPLTGHIGEQKPTVLPLRPHDGRSRLDAWVRHEASLIKWDASFWEDNHTEDDWLIEPWLPAKRSGSLFAPAKAGKSLYVTEQVAGLATGRSLFGRPPARPRRVLYLDMEMTPDDLRERLEDMGYGPDDDLSNLFYQSLPALPPLDTPGGGLEVVELAHHYDVELVVVDTLSRVISGAENESDTLRAFYSHTGRPLKSADIACLRLDHAGKDLEKGQRGTSAKADDVDYVWELSRRTKSSQGTQLSGPPQFQLRATHRRNAWLPERVNLIQHDNPLRYEIEPHPIPPGTKDAMEALDRLGVPLNASRRTAQRILREHDSGVRNEVLAAALESRRRREIRLEHLRERAEDEGL